MRGRRLAPVVEIYSVSRRSATGRLRLLRRQGDTLCGRHAYLLLHCLDLVPLVLKLCLRQAGFVRACATLRDQFLKFRPVGLRLCCQLSRESCLKLCC